jgi:hypothetical protein
MDAVYSSRAKAAAKIMKMTSKWCSESRSLSGKELVKYLDEGE